MSSEWKKYTVREGVRIGESKWHEVRAVRIGIEPVTVATLDHSEEVELDSPFFHALYEPAPPTARITKRG